jgi:hypothetical protein
VLLIRIRIMQIRIQDYRHLQIQIKLFDECRSVSHSQINLYIIKDFYTILLLHMRVMTSYLSNDLVIAFGLALLFLLIPVLYSEF